MTPRSDLMVSVSGIRGVVGQGLTAAEALRFAQALGTFVEGKPVVLGRDSRPSGEMLKAAVSAGLMSVGCPVLDVGVVPTPTVGLTVRELGAGGAIQVTASHNPASYNGLKLFGSSGAVLSAREGEQLLGIYRAGPPPQSGWRNVGRPLAVADPVARHVERVVAAVDASAISQRGLRVLVDANHGAGGPAMCRLLERLGCTVAAVGCTPDGEFAHEPEPIAENLTGIVPNTVAQQCDLGLALDPDADRLALIDEKGRYIGEELTLALALEFRLREQPGPVVVNMSSSRVNEDVARRHGCPFFRSPVGEAHVVEKMQAAGAVLGGEGNGGVIDPRIGWVRDPLIGMGLILNLLAVERRPLSEVVAGLPRYAMVKQKQQADLASLPAWYSRWLSCWPDATADRSDGLRLDWPDRWLHVRPSNTEPVVRLIAEAPTETEARQLVRAALAAVS